MERLVTSNTGFSVIYEIDQQGTVLVRDRQDGMYELPYGPIVAVRVHWAAGKFNRPHGRFTVWLDERDGSVAPIVVSRRSDFSIERRVSSSFGKAFRLDPLDSTAWPRLKTWWTLAGETPPHRSMTQVNSDSPNYFDATNSINTNTLSFTPTSGNLLITGVTTDQAETFTAPSGYTVLQNVGYHGGSGFAYKTAAGSETSIVWDWATANDSQSYAIEFSGYNGSGHEVTATNSTGSNVTALSAGPTGSTSTANSLVAAHRAHSSHDSFTSYNWTGGSPAITEVIKLTGSPGGGECWGAYADTDITATQTVSLTVNNTTADQTAIAIASWGESGGGGPSATHPPYPLRTQYY